MLEIVFLLFCRYVILSFLSFSVLSYLLAENCLTAVFLSPETMQPMKPHQSLIQVSSKFLNFVLQASSKSQWNSHPKKQHLTDPIRSMWILWYSIQYALEKEAMNFVQIYGWLKLKSCFSRNLLCRWFSECWSKVCCKFMHAWTQATKTARPCESSFAIPRVCNIAQSQS